MGSTTKIEWADATWGPVTGCTKVSAGCDNCYAETFAERWRGTPGHYFENGFDVQLRRDKLYLPMRWKKPRRIFVNSMSDLFHDAVPDDYIAQVFTVMALARQHTFQVLTKRHARMRSLLNKPEFIWPNVWGPIAPDLPDLPYRTWPLPNVWLGVSAENQQWADIRIPALLDTPAAVRFVSAEPLLGPIDLHIDPIEASSPFWGSQLDWVITGGESGPGARPAHPDWFRAIRDQCQAAGVAFLFKQWGEWQPSSPRQEMVANGRRYRYARRWIHPDGSTADYFEPSTPMDRVGKHRAGRELDGRTWDGYPGEAS